jgi:uncharacterized protein YegL
MPNKMQQVMEELTQEDKKSKNYTVFILDRSSSMRSFGPEAADTFNEQVRATKAALAGKSHIEAEVSLLTFASKVDKPEIWCRPIGEISELKQEDYVPDGMTALHDAIGWAITELQKQPDIKEDTTSVLFIIVSDGGENNSRTWKNQIGGMIAEMEATKRWTFVYEGASEQLAADAVQLLNVSHSNSMSFGSSRKSLRRANRRRSRKADAYFTGVASGQMRSLAYHDGGLDDTQPEPEDVTPEIDVSTTGTTSDTNPVGS